MTTYITKSDADIALDFACRIPSGRWTNYGEIAECVMAVTPERRRTLSGFTVANLLLPLPASTAPWHRLRNAQGVFNVPGTDKRNHADVQNGIDQLLRDEGCSVSGHHASQANHVSANQLLALVPASEERLVEARAADPDLAARVAAKRAARMENR